FDVSSEELTNFYQNALFCVYPSVFEGFGIPILEAFSHGKTVATSQISSMPEVGGDAAKYFYPNNLAQIEQALLFLMDDQNRKELEKRIPNQLKKFSSDKLVTDYVQVYKSLA
ncbi:MAG: glycosyltransferase, partial [Bacteroidia bacterium]|nr:glycosyltransferase [Bacteroidia bacterium]